MLTRKPATATRDKGTRPTPPHPAPDYLASLPSQYEPNNEIILQGFEDTTNGAASIREDGVHGTNGSREPKARNGATLIGTRQDHFNNRYRNSLFIYTTEPAHNPDGDGRDGRNATYPTRGRDAGNIDVLVSTMPAADGPNSNSSSSSSSAQIVVEGIATSHAEERRVCGAFNVSRDIALSAKGGNGGAGGWGGDGGRGSNGYRGENANSIEIGTDGGPGGNGGHGGDGTHGANGGTGGKITVRVKDEESFLLMAVPATLQASRETVRGGFPGVAGRHGRAGEGGRGGKGGGSYGYGKDRNKGGKDGPSGRRGLIPTIPLFPGNHGEPGRFQIVVMGENDDSFDSRYDLRLHGVDFVSPMAIQPDTLEFEDVVSIRNMTCENFGGMISPVDPSEVSFGIRTAYSWILPNQNNSMDGNDTTCDPLPLLQTRIEPHQTGCVKGGLSFRVARPPNVRRMGQDDTDPLVYHERLFLGATQLGPFGFRRPYETFHPDGLLLHFRFPVENSTGLEGVSTLRPGRGAHIRFKITNISRYDIGVESKGKRPLVVRFYRNPSSEYNIPSSRISLTMEGQECRISKQRERGTQFPINLLSSGETKELSGVLTFSSDVKPYGRFALQAELLLGTLYDHIQDDNPPRASDKEKKKKTFKEKKKKKSKKKKKKSKEKDEEEKVSSAMIPIQMRKLEVKAEPRYLPSGSNHVVLITSAGTNQDQFNAWTDLLSNRLGLSVEYYSVSIYGSLDPKFVPRDGTKSLKDCFQGKCAIILDEPFAPLLARDASSGMTEPSKMLPNGCQHQTSGYCASTKWLLVGPSPSAVQQALSSHYTAPVNDISTYKSIKEFLMKWKEMLQREQESGRVDENANILVAEIEIQLKRPVYWKQGIFYPGHFQKQLNREADLIRRYVSKLDPLRRYTVSVPEASPDTAITNADGQYLWTVTVRRGYCRTKNSVHVFSTPAKDSASIRTSRNLKFAVLQALPTETLHKVFCNYISDKSNSDSESSSESETELESSTMSVSSSESSDSSGGSSSSSSSSSSDYDVVEGCLDVLSQGLLWDVANIIDGSLCINKLNLFEAFPTLAECFGSQEFRKVLSQWHTGEVEVATCFSRLLARFECVAKTKDLNPLGLVRSRLRKAVKKLESEWKECMLPEVKKKERAAVKEAVLSALKKQPQPLFVLQNIYPEWQKGLLYASSWRNEEKYSCDQPVLPLFAMEGSKSAPHKTVFAIPPKTVIRKSARNVAIWNAQKQVKEAAETLDSIQAVRLRETTTSTKAIQIDSDSSNE